MLEVFKKYNVLVQEAFDNNSGFVAALDKVYGKFFDLNDSGLPELMAKYCDSLLIKGIKNLELTELEFSLDQVVSLKIKSFQDISQFNNKVTLF